jgi:hypothetical protein
MFFSLTHRAEPFLRSCQLWQVFRLAASFLLVAILAYSLILKMEAVLYYRTSVNFHQTTRRHILKIILILIVKTVRSLNATNHK